MALEYVQTHIVQFFTILVIIRILAYVLRKYLLDRPFQWTSKPGTRWAIVTGSTDGIGEEFARSLALKGYNIALLSRTEAKLRATKEKIEAELAQIGGTLTKVKVETLAVDFTRTDIYETIKMFLDGKDIQILINNVGMAPKKAQNFLETIAKNGEFNQNLINVNITAMVRLCELILPKMVAQQDGLVVNISSMSGNHCTAGLSTYGASKVNRFTQPKTID